MQAVCGLLWCWDDSAQLQKRKRGCSYATVSLPFLGEVTGHVASGSHPVFIIKTSWFAFAVQYCTGFEPLATWPIV
jgi:hypothetical protein